MKNVTIVDIARLAEVSQATVSRVLNSPDKVREATREKVRRIMAEHHYVYNALAGGLSRKRTKTLGLVIPTITNPVFSASTNGIQNAASQRDYSIILGNSEYRPDQELALIRLFSEKQVDGIILTGRPQHGQTIPFLRKRGIDYVVTYERIEDGCSSYVSFDNTAAARRSVDYLVMLGHTRIGMITGPFSSSGRSLRRWQGYREALEKAGIPYDASLVVQRDFTVVDGKEAMLRLLQSADTPTAVFCGNDILAYGAMVAARETGLQVGKDISIVGFDDLEMSAIMEPPLTTTRIPGETMGEMAATVLIDQVEGLSDGAARYELETDFIVRESVSKINA